MFGDLRKEVGEAISKVCRMEGVTSVRAAMLPDGVTAQCFSFISRGSSAFKKYALFTKEGEEKAAV